MKSLLDFFIRDLQRLVRRIVVLKITYSLYTYKQIFYTVYENVRVYFYVCFYKIFLLFYWNLYW